MTNFNEMGLDQSILKGIESLGFVNATEIQSQAIPKILSSKNDLIALAQTGTGKTAAFSLPILQQIDLSDRSVQTLVLCPTRELCIQIAKDMVSYCKFVSGLRVTAVYGGAAIVNQIKELRSGSQIVVGTPGRVNDLIRRKVLKIESIKYLVLDEADEMLNMGFKEELDEILVTTPEEKQTLLFSATMPKEIAKIAEKYMHDPDRIEVGTRNSGSDQIAHEYYMVHAKDRYQVLKRLADINPNIYGIVFCRTRQETKDIADKLIHDGYNADALHGDLSQAQRDHVMNRFRKKNLQLLVATDVAARGLDVNDLSHVINFNLPDDPEVYVHRSGRTGRAGKTGVSIAIIHMRDMNKIKQIERLAKQPFVRKQVPTGREICEKQLFNLVDRVEKIEVDKTQIEQFLPVIYKKLDWLSREELIQHFVSVEFNRFLAYYKNATDLNVEERHQRSDSGKRQKQSKAERRRNEINYKRFYINLGSTQDIDPTRLIGMINKQLRRRDLPIGKIEILKKFSFFEIADVSESDVQRAFNKLQVAGIPVVVELSNPDPKSKPDFRGRERSGRQKKRKNFHR